MWCGAHLVQTRRTGVQGNSRTCTMLSERDVHSSFHCSQPYCSSFRCSSRFGRTQNKATTRQPGIFCGWSGRLEQATTGHSFGTYIITLSTFKNMIKTHLFYRSYFTDCFQSTSSEDCRRHCSDSSHVIAPYKLSFYYYYYYY